MDSQDSMFLFEIVVEELTSHINCREFCIRSQFADVFNINLKDPNEMRSYLKKKPKRPKRKTKVRNGKTLSNSASKTAKVQTGQSILFANNVETLIANMKQYPMELSLWSKVLPDYKIGSTQIPWSTQYIDFLNKLNKKNEPPSVTVVGNYNVFHETTSKRMAVIKLNIKLSYLRDKITTQFKALSEETPQTFMYTGFNSRRESVLSTIIDRPINFSNEPGIIKTIYSDSRRNLRKFSVDKIVKASDKRIEIIELPDVSDHVTPGLKITELNDDHCSTDLDSTSSIKSEADLHKSTHMAIIKSKSCSTVSQEQLNFLSYIFGSSTGLFSNQIYCVGYFTVENSDSPPLVALKSADSRNDTLSEKSGKSAKSAKSEKSEKSDKSDKSEKTEKTEKTENTDNSATEKSEQPETSDKVKEKYRFRICDSECPMRKNDTSGRASTCSFDIPPEAARLISAVKKCDQVICDHKVFRKLPTPPDDHILLGFSSLMKECCDNKVKDLGGKVSGMKLGDAPCFCRCTCSFGFVRKTTYCEICGGYEIAGDAISKRPIFDTNFPCPIYHKLVDLNKGRTKALSISGSDSKKKDSKHKAVDKPDKPEQSERAEREKPEKSGKTKKTIESERETTTKKGKKKRKDDRFRFNYGYTAPHIGHSRCALPCSGALGAVPKRMGWLWNAEDVPGIKYRPLYKPGAANKHVVRLLKIAKNPGQVLAKKRKKESSKGKRPLKRPLLTVQKKDGEYTVTMETMKTYAKQRTYNQYPYEDKPLVTYTIGRTEEENIERKKKKERAQRRLERLQREFIQSAFRDMCQEICLKTYQQALGMLPDAEKPDCLCYPIQPGPDRTDLEHSCSCSEDKSLSESDTDSDEWIVEFTPPNATFDPSYKAKKIAFADNSTQYTYMDYRVKLLDRFGNPVPRFFKGPDGKTQCSDLGGFWSPEHKWLEINTDGFIGPDEKWAPNIFMGPNGEQVDAETGKFQALNGKWLVVGIDGYVDIQGKWKFYPKPKEETEPTKRHSKQHGENKDEQAPVKQSQATWSCFGSVSPKQLSKMGIIGHGHDKKLLLSALKDLLAQGEDVKIPEPSTVPRITTKGKVKRSSGPTPYNLSDRRKCKHATPSDKGIVAVDEHGNKTYFRLKDFANKRPKQRIKHLTDQGISLSSFHVPCFHSFISSEIAKKQKYERLVALSKGANANHKGTATTTSKPAQTGAQTTTAPNTTAQSLDFPSSTPYNRID